VFLVHVWRPEATTATGIYSYDPTNPFDGIELFGICADEAEANALIDRAQRNMEPKPGSWKFHIEPVTSQMQEKAIEILDPSSE